MPETITATIRQRFSCRSYLTQPLEPRAQAELEAFIQALSPGPFGTRGRFVLAAVSAAERGVLRGLGTYGFVKGAPAYLIGACRETGRGLEDFGWQMEQIVLKATALGWGTCWLGGTFTRSNFAGLVGAGPDEIIPAVSPVGLAADRPRRIDNLVRQVAGSADRLDWNRLFFDGAFDAPLSPAAAGPFAEALEMVRLGPSASNKQPWRVIKDGDAWHFYLQRTPGYRESWITRLLGVADLQRADLGIALCHFELSARAAGLPGGWQQLPQPPPAPDALTHYLVSWAARQ